MSSQYLSLVRKQNTPIEDRPSVTKKPGYVVYRHKIAHGLQLETIGTESSAEEADGIQLETDKPSFAKRLKQTLTLFNREKSEKIRELSPRKKRKSKRKAKPEPATEGVLDLETAAKNDFNMYLPRRPGPFFKVVIISSVILMLFIIYGNSKDSLQLHNLSIVHSLPNIFDPAVLMRAKPARIVDLMGDSNDVLIRENITSILEHRIFFREAVPRSNITSNEFTVVLLHDKHTESGGGTGCCSGLWLWLGTLHRLGREGFHVVAIDLPGFGFSEGVQLDIRESAPFMKELIQLFKLQSIILVSPSNSIKVSLPFASSNPEYLDGLVIPSPLTTQKYTNEANMAQMDIPTLITYGADDKNAINDYERVLSHIPNHKLIEIESRTVDDGVKLVYLDDPSHFHDNLVDFAKTLKQRK